MVGTTRSACSNRLRYDLPYFMASTKHSGGDNSIAGFSTNKQRALAKGLE